MRFRDEAQFGWVKGQATAEGISLNEWLLRKVEDGDGRKAQAGSDKNRGAGGAAGGGSPRRGTEHVRAERERWAGVEIQGGGTEHNADEGAVIRAIGTGGDTESAREGEPRPGATGETKKLIHRAFPSGPLTESLISAGEDARALSRSVQKRVVTQKGEPAPEWPEGTLGRAVEDTHRHDPNFCRIYGCLLCAEEKKK